MFLCTKCGHRDTIYRQKCPKCLAQGSMEKEPLRISHREDRIRYHAKKLKYTCKDIEEESLGQITEVMLKHFLNMGKMADQDTIQLLAKSIYYKNEYTNRATLSAVLTKIENAFSTIGIGIETSPLRPIENSCFWRHYLSFQALTKTTSGKTKNGDFCNGMFLGYIMNSLKNNT